MWDNFNNFTVIYNASSTFYVTATACFQQFLIFTIFFILYTCASRRSFKAFKTNDVAKQFTSKQDENVLTRSFANDAKLQTRNVTSLYH